MSEKAIFRWPESSMSQAKTYSTNGSLGFFQIEVYELKFLSIAVKDIFPKEKNSTMDSTLQWGQIYPLPRP